MEGYCIEKKIYYHDTDAGGVMYYANYLKHLEEGRSEFFFSKGLDVACLAEKGVMFPVAHFEIDYKSPARHGDIIHILTSVEKTGFSSIHFLQEIKKEGLMLATARTLCACVDEKLKPRALPDEVKKALS